MNERLRVSSFAIVLALAGMSPGAVAQSSCGAATTAGDDETLSEIAGRCGVSVEALREANPELAGEAVAAGTEVEMPEAASGDLLGRTRELLRDAGQEIERAARDAGQSVSDYLSSNPDIGGDLRDLGERYGLPGFSTGSAEAWAGMTVTPAAPKAGEEVTISASGFRANAPAEIGIGPSRTNYEMVGEATADASGHLETTLTLPDWVSASENVVFVVETDNVVLRSDPVEVAAE
jgi:hypothetical protein